MTKSHIMTRRERAVFDRTTDPGISLRDMRIAIIQDFVSRSCDLDSHIVIPSLNRLTNSDLHMLVAAIEGEKL